MTRSGTAYRLAPSAPLTGATASGSWPIPCAEDAKNVPYQKGKDGVTRYPMLLGAVDPARMWPTPTQSDGMGGPGSSGRDGGENLRTAANGALNPTWVEWLMGYALGWTVCEAWGMRSSRRLPNGSGGGFSGRHSISNLTSSYSR
jgi:hypothetical protein